MTSDLDFGEFVIEQMEEAVEIIYRKCLVTMAFIVMAR